MRVQTITVARLINTGNFENFRVELAAVLDDGDDLYQAGAALAVAIVEIGRAALVRLFPDEKERAWHHWFDEEK